MRMTKLIAAVVFFAILGSGAATASDSSPLRILLTNDDGWDSPAIQAMKDRLRANGHEVILTAPAENRSGSGASLTLEAVAVVEQGPDEFAIDGTPAACVFIGLILMGEAPDLVISGANIGFNGGNGGIHSGTIGAAFTGVESGIPALAIATDSPSSDPTDAVSAAHFANVADFTARLVDRLARHSHGHGLLPRGIVLKVGYTPLDPADVAGIRLAEQGEAGLFNIGYTEVAPGLFAPTITPGDPADLDPNSDVALFLDGNVTLLPLDIDQTAARRVHARVRIAVLGLQP